jgi:2-amino-4-hydroxy-6-hydroxymethyldihydropteridine diphosphokinase
MADDAPPARYVIALGSNRRHPSHGGPAAVLSAALAVLEAAKVRVIARSRIIRTPALGPAGRDFANAVALVSSPLDPLALLALVKGIERAFGRRRGRRWGARVLDIDLILWSGGPFRSRSLVIPHASLAERRFVLDPLVEVAGAWRLPDTALTPRHLRARLARSH